MSTAEMQFLTSVPRRLNDMVSELQRLNENIEKLVKMKENGVSDT